MKPCKSIALALSGGGIRAMVFHMGVLKALAERDLLEKVSRISTVSGGSLLLGLMLQENNLKWPTSKEFIDHIYPHLRAKLCSKSIMFGAIKQLLYPQNWKYLFSRANLVAKTLENDWQVIAKLNELPSQPECSINGTPAENGVRFRFKKDSMGDYNIGYTSPRNYKLANAIAISAAFPGGIGPLVLDTTKYEWKSWSPVGLGETKPPPYSKLHLYDGGVYDNLGLEPYFDSGKLKAKVPDAYIIASDAGAPLKTGFSFWVLNPFRLMRVLDIISNQARALRVRTFATYIQTEKTNGAYIYINTPLIDGSNCENARFASSYPTDLKKVSEVNFDKIARYGYKVTKKVESEYGLYPEDTID
jgi:NTE family protein